MAQQIYNQHRAAFASVEAYVIARDGERAATIAFKFPRDGAGRLYAYVHWLGEPMVRGFAGGGGYDKRSAACAAAARKLELSDGAYTDGMPHNSAEERAAWEAFRDALAKDDGMGWDRNLMAAGFNVWQAV